MEGHIKNDKMDEEIYQKMMDDSKILFNQTLKEAEVLMEDTPLRPEVAVRV